MMSCNDNHHGTQMPLTSAVHTITVILNAEPELGAWNYVMPLGEIHPPYSEVSPSQK